MNGHEMLEFLLFPQLMIFGFFLHLRKGHETHFKRISPKLCKNYWFYGCATSRENHFAGFFLSVCLSAKVLLLVALKTDFKGSRLELQPSLIFADEFSVKVNLGTSSMLTTETSDH